jgi:hypothetical protein
MGAEQRERKRRRHKGGGWEVILITKDIWGRSTCASGYFTDGGYFDPFGKVFQAISNRKFDCTVDVV